MPIIFKELIPNLAPGNVFNIFLKDKDGQIYYFCTGGAEEFEHLVSEEVLNMIVIEITNEERYDNLQEDKVFLDIPEYGKDELCIILEYDVKKILNRDYDKKKHLTLNNIITLLQSKQLINLSACPDGKEDCFDIGTYDISSINTIKEEFKNIEVMDIHGSQAGEQIGIFLKLNRIDYEKIVNSSKNAIMDMQDLTK